MPRPAIHPGESLADEMTVARKAGLEIAQLPTRPASPVGDQPKQSVNLIKTSSVPAKGERDKLENK